LFTVTFHIPLAFSRFVLFYVNIIVPFISFVNMTLNFRDGSKNLKTTKKLN